MVSFKRVGLAALLITPVLALGIPAQAASLATVPKVTISGKPAVYKPASISAVPHWNGIESCTTALGSFTIANNTSATQEIIDGTTDLGNLPAHETTSVCINTNQKGKTDHFKLGSNKKAALAVKVT